MNLLIKRSALFFSALLTLASCDEATDIGEDLQESEIGTYYTDTITVEASTILLKDSINAYKSNPLLAGFMTDPDLGTITASTFTELALSSGSVKFGASDSLLDAALILDYTFYGDGSKPLKLNVYQLKENFNEEQSYFTSSEIPYDAAAPIGTVTFTPDYILVNKKPLVIPLTEAFAQSLFSKSGKTELSSQQEFNKFIKGIAIVPASDQEPGTKGSVLYIDAFSQKTRLALNYLDRTSVSGTPAYTTYNFLVRESSARFNRITSDRTGSTLSSLVKSQDDIPSEQTSNVTYLQAGSGIRTKITFPYLDNLRKRHGNIAINKAELVIPLKPETTSPLTPPPLLFLYESAGNRISTNTSKVQKAVQTDGGAYLNSVNSPASLTLKNNTYNLVMTSYVQAMLADKKPKELILSTTSNAVSVARGVINAEPDGPGNSASRIRLKVYFSKIN